MSHKNTSNLCGGLKGFYPIWFCVDPANTELSHVSFLLDQGYIQELSTKKLREVFSSSALANSIVVRFPTHDESEGCNLRNSRTTFLMFYFHPHLFLGEGELPRPPANRQVFYLSSLVVSKVLLCVLYSSQWLIRQTVLYYLWP